MNKCKHCGENNIDKLMSHIRKGKLIIFNSCKVCYSKNLSVKRKGRVFSKETKKKISESLKGNVNGRFRKGCTLTEKHKFNLSKSHSGKTLSVKHKLNLSKARKSYISKHSKINGKRISPHIGKNEKQILDLVEIEKRIKLERQYQVLHYFIDGYDKENNVVYEVDEKHHNNPKVIKKDLLRQKEIKEYLNCEFVRIKDY